MPSHVSSMRDAPVTARVTRKKGDSSGAHVLHDATVARSASRDRAGHSAVRRLRRTESSRQGDQPAFLIITRGELAAHAHDALAVEGGQIEGRVLARLRKAVKGKSLEIDRVSIDHIDFDKTVTGAIASKVSAEQLIGQKENELQVAKRDADIARMLAAGRADAVRSGGTACRS